MIWIRKLCGCRPVTVHDHEFLEHGFEDVAACSYDSDVKKKKEIKRKATLSKTSVVPILKPGDLEKNSKSAAKEAWGTKKRSKPKLKKKSSLGKYTISFDTRMEHCS